MNRNNYTGLRCYDSCLMHIIREEGGEPLNYLCRIWQTPWKDSGLLGERLQFDTGIRKLMEKYGDLDCSQAGCDSIEEWKYGGGNYTMAEIDTYYYPIHRLYQEEHATHFCLYYAKTGEQIGFIDPMLSDKICWVPKQQVYQGLLAVEKIHIGDCDSLGGTVLRGEMLECYSGMSSESHLMKLYDYMKHSIDLQEEYKGLREKKYDIPLYRSLWSIMFGRTLYSLLLQSFQPQNEMLIRLLGGIFDEWQEIRGMLAKQYIRGQHSLTEECLRKIGFVIGKEKEAHKINVSYLEGK